MGDIERKMNRSVYVEQSCEYVRRMAPHPISGAKVV